MQKCITCLFHFLEYPLKSECVCPCGGVIKSRCTRNLLTLVRVASNPNLGDLGSVKPRFDNNNNNNNTNISLNKFFLTKISDRSIEIEIYAINDNQDVLLLFFCYI